ncbi:hypothetical protein PCL_00090 [Purpureocillium lilacinum]|uniref:Uncharacterized protein n=1 Tax=Purpureocillium lilacinum TaxID=33203 RepID=A0A2U3E633_PURLI|nr:hypothetical protein Purlil1_5712 [Purpureocillium lilacinum]PWI69946.1 hypothetical protein PCL_00090 [Purpureocillium lilacinum]
MPLIPQSTKQKEIETKRTEANQPGTGNRAFRYRKPATVKGGGRPLPKFSTPRLGMTARPSGTHDATLTMMTGVVRLGVPTDNIAASCSGVHHNLLPRPSRGKRAAGHPHRVQMHQAGGPAWHPPRVLRTYNFLTRQATRATSSQDQCHVPSSQAICKGSARVMYKEVSAASTSRRRPATQTPVKSEEKTRNRRAALWYPPERAVRLKMLDAIRDPRRLSGVCSWLSSRYAVSIIVTHPSSHLCPNRRRRSKNIFLARSHIMRQHRAPQQALAPRGLGNCHACLPCAGSPPCEPMPRPAKACRVNFRKRTYERPP